MHGFISCLSGRWIFNFLTDCSRIGFMAVEAPLGGILRFEKGLFVWSRRSSTLFEGQASMAQSLFCDRDRLIYRFSLQLSVSQKDRMPLIPPKNFIWSQETLLRSLLMVKLMLCWCILWSPRIFRELRPNWKVDHVWASPICSINDILVWWPANCGESLLKNTRIFVHPDIHLLEDARYSESNLDMFIMPSSSRSTQCSVKSFCSTCSLDQSISYRHSIERWAETQYYRGKWNEIRRHRVRERSFVSTTVRNGGRCYEYR